LKCWQVSARAGAASALAINGGFASSGLTERLYDLRRAQAKIGKSIKALPALKRRELVQA